MKEVWKTMEGFGGFYQISNQGKLRSIDRVVVFKDGRKRMVVGKEMALTPNKKRYGYVYVGWSYENRLYSDQIHRLVAGYFIPNPENKPQVNHKDGDKQNNKVDNLEWSTPKENGEHAARNGLVWKKLSKDSVKEIKKRLRLGETRASLARAFNTTESNLRFIDLGVSWGHV